MLHGTKVTYVNFARIQMDMYHEATTGPSQSGAKVEAIRQTAMNQVTMYQGAEEPHRTQAGGVPGHQEHPGQEGRAVDGGGRP